jgi:formylglycine-generating enzyme required for sulfatase activity
VVHRDIKPENIFFDAHWGAFLGDFGIAKVIAESGGFNQDLTLTATSMAIGTQHYMAPEQFSPKAVIDGRTDQYALALTVYELLSGERPFRGEDANLIVEILTMPPPPLPSRRSGLPRPLVAAVHKALSKRPEERFATCRAFVDAALTDVPPLPDQPDIARLMCPQCGNILKLRSNAAGRTGKCPKCKTDMRVAHDLESLWLLGEDGDPKSYSATPHETFVAGLSAQLPTWTSGAGWLIAGVLTMGVLVMAFSPNRPVGMPPTAVAEPSPVGMPAETEWAEHAETLPPTEPLPDDRVAKARESLDRDPDNPMSHGVLGRFYCFIEERWDQGLDHLAKCETPALATVAKEELATRSIDASGRPGAVLEVAKAWWRLKTGGLLPEAEADAIGRHAIEMYRGALDQITTDRDIAVANAWLDADEAFRMMAGNTRPKTPRPTSSPESRSAAAPEKAESSRTVRRQPQTPPRPAALVATPADILARPPLENSIGMKLKLLPPGTFKMGSNEGDPDEMPIHTVRITSGFFLGVYEVTNAQWQKVVGASPSVWRFPDHPVETVSWDDALAFCRSLSDLPEERAAGRVYRLPTEAEWEYGCRAGTQSEFSFGDDRELLSEYGWFAGNSGGQTRPVGGKRPNAWGLHDMHGNAWEWCADGYGPYTSEEAIDPSGLPASPVKVYRGGTWGYVARECRSAKRRGIDAGHRDHYRGFRVVMAQRQVP